MSNPRSQTICGMMTNIDYIRSLPPRELSKFLYSVYLSCCICCSHQGSCSPTDRCREEIMQWLTQEKDVEKKKWDDMPIDQMGLTPSVFNGLYKAGIHTVGELTRYTAYDLSKIPHLGEKAVKEIEAQIFKITKNRI